MERNREARRASMAAPANGLSRRRHRSGSLRDSPDEDGAVELTETARLRDRGVKKDRDRDRERERRSKRRRGERLMHGSNREDGGEYSSEESVNDEEEDEDEGGSGGGGGGGAAAAVRMLPPTPAMAAVAAASMPSNHHLQHRKTFSPSAPKVLRAAPVWKAGDEMIGVSVPRKARSACAKRSHDWTISSGNGGVGAEQIHRQASTSPVRPPSHVSTQSQSPARPISPSSSNASAARKKIKPNGPKQRLPKSSSKSSTSNPEELEIEIAEVLYGLMTQSQAPSKKELLPNDSREVNKSSSDAKSRVSSPISNSLSSSVPQSSPILPLNPSSTTLPLSAVAPKRKRPRQVSDNLGSFSVRSRPMLSTATKVEMDQQHQVPKSEISSPNLEKNSGSAADNSGAPFDLVNSQALPSSSEPAPESLKLEVGALSDSKLLAVESAGQVLTKEEFTSTKIDTAAAGGSAGGDNHEDATGTAKATKVNSTISKLENQREEKFQIDLMAPPPQLRSSPGREGGQMDFGVTEDQKKTTVSDEMQPRDKDDEKLGKNGKDEAADGGEKTVKPTTDEVETPKLVDENKGRNIDLQLDLEKLDRESGLVSGSISKLQHQAPKQQQPSLKANAREEQQTEKTAQSSSLPLPISISSWPGGLSPMGYIAPLQSAVSIDGSTLPSAPIQPLFSQPRPKRCATHCYIARSIQNLQQFIKMNPFWSAAAGSASLFNAQPCNLNLVPPGDLLGNIPGRAVNPVQDKGQGLAIFPGHAAKDKSAQAANTADAAQRKQQILLQQAMPPVGPSNILPGPAFIFPLNQQQAAVAAAAARPGPTKTPTTSANMVSSIASNSAAGGAPASAAGQATALSFNYPNMGANETQYLAILQNNGYPFPIPAVGAPPNYRGTHAQAMPFFNGSIYSSQMIHPSQIQLQQPPPPSQSQQMQQGHQNSSISGGSSSSQKHLQNQQQRPQSGVVNGGSGNGSLHNFPAPKNRSSQPHQQQSQHIPPTQGRQLESNDVGEDSPSTADSRVSRPTMGIYSQNFAVPIHAQNFAIMTPALGSVTTAPCSGNPAEKKLQSQQGFKVGVEPLPPQTFAMSFAPINGATPNTPGIDPSSMAHNHAILQGLPEASRQNYQIIVAAAAAQAAQQKKNFGISAEGKAGGIDSSNVDDDRNCVVGKLAATVGQSIAFSRSDLTDAPGSAIPSNTVVDSSIRTLNLASGPPRTSRSPLPSAVGTVNATSSQLHAKLSLQHQQQILQLHKQQQQQQQEQQLAEAVAARSKTPATSNGSIYSENITSAASVGAKFPNAISAFPPTLLQSSNNSSPTQSPQWKNSTRPTNSQVPSSLASSTTSSLKNLSQQPSRSQQSHTHISFGTNPKSSPAPQGQPPPNINQSSSPPMVVGSPTTSISKGASGSPRTTTSASTNNKIGQASTLSSQQAKNSSASSQKSPPAGGRNVTSILGNPHIITNTSSTGTKPHMLQQQLFFSNTYMQAQASHSTNSAPSAKSGYYTQRRRPEQLQAQPQPHQPPGSSASSSAGMLSLCPPVTLAGASTSDAKAVAVAAASNMKGGGLPSQGILHATQFAAQSLGNTHQILPASFSYVHTIPPAVQVKPAEQKQPAGE